MMRIVVITDVPFGANEAEAIRQLLDEGADRIHLRKPGAAESDMRRLIEALPTDSYPRLSLHDHTVLAAEYGLGGVHLNARFPTVPKGFGGLVSRSCHSITEAASHREADYLFLSPVFDSISKEGYRSAYSDAELHDAARQGLIGQQTIALGGIRPDHLPCLRAYGFGGAAFLGYVWKNATLPGLKRRMEEIRKFNTL